MTRGTKRRGETGGKRRQESKEGDGDFTGRVQEEFQHWNVDREVKVSKESISETVGIKVEDGTGEGPWSWYVSRGPP